VLVFAGIAVVLRAGAWALDRWAGVPQVRYPCPDCGGELVAEDRQAAELRCTGCGHGYIRLGVELERKVVQLPGARIVERPPGGADGGG
jgi:DNA-directed RNA polymerase subunit RPC12/RpoP